MAARPLSDELAQQALDAVELYKYEALAADALGIPRGTMRSFLTGGQLVMRERWQLVATPYDEIAA